MSKRIIKSLDAPAPVGPYSQAVVAGNTLYVSGQIPLDPYSNKLIDSNISLATKQVLDNISAILAEAGFNFAQVVKTTIFITDMAKFQDVNAVYSTYFTDWFPARETVEVSKLPLGAMVEISLIAVK